MKSIEDTIIISTFSFWQDGCPRRHSLCVYPNEQLQKSVSCLTGFLPSSSNSDQSSPLTSSSISLPSSAEASSSKSLSSSSLSSSSNSSSLISNSEAESLSSSSSSDSVSRNFQPPSLKNWAGSSLTVFMIVVQLRLRGPSENAMSQELDLIKVLVGEYSSQLLTLSRCSIGIELMCTGVR